MYNFEIGSFYTFTTKAPAILGVMFKNVEVLGIVDYSTACKYINVDLQHRIIYPMLTPGVVDNPKKYTYLLIKTQDGVKTVIAYPWIDETSIKQVSSATIVVTFTNMAISDANDIKNTLSLAGYKGFTVDVQ